MATSRFADIQQAPPIEVFHVMKAFSDSTHEKKVNLSVGGEKTEIVIVCNHLLFTIYLFLLQVLPVFIRCWRFRE